MTPEEIAALQGHYVQQAQQPTLASEIDQIIDVGRTHFGNASFDDASQVVAGALGEKSAALMDTLRHFDRPHEVLVHLANNETQLKALAKLPQARQAVEIAKIESQLASTGHVGAEPAWKNPSTRSGRVSDEDWSQNFGANLSDRQWAAEFDRRQATRTRR